MPRKTIFSGKVEKNYLSIETLLGNIFGPSEEIKKGWRIESSPCSHIYDIRISRESHKLIPHNITLEYERRVEVGNPKRHVEITLCGEENQVRKITEIIHRLPTNDKEDYALRKATAERLEKKWNEKQAKLQKERKERKERVRRLVEEYGQPVEIPELPVKLAFKDNTYDFYSKFNAKWPGCCHPDIWVLMCKTPKNTHEFDNTLCLYISDFDIFEPPVVVKEESSDCTKGKLRSGEYSILTHEEFERFTEPTVDVYLGPGKKKLSWRRNGTRLIRSTPELEAFVAQNNPKLALEAL